MKNLITQVSALGAIAVVGACALGAGDINEQTESEGADVLPIGELTVPGGIELRFGVDDDGGIVVSEAAPIGGVSPISALMVLQGATPLELFLALAADDAEPPTELVAAHRELAVIEGIAQEPRRLSLEVALANAKKNGTLSASAANCNLSSDGGWFDLTWAWLGWNWHWYWRTNAEYTSSATTPRRTHMRSHVCNDGPSGDKWHKVQKSSCTSGGSTVSYLGNDRVKSEYRNTVVRSHSSSACYFKNIIEKPIAPPRGKPTYSHGIMTP